MKALVIGYGSIGIRHIRLLTELGYSVAVVSSRNIDYHPNYKTIEDALIKFQPDYVIIANKTCQHYSSIVELTQHGFSGFVLVEKPLFDQLREIPENNFKGFFIGYNLRFHPILQKLHEILLNEKMISAHAYVGQYLPEWRPNTDYRDSYSASKNSGGGVLRDLSHELDYMNWLIGGWRSLVAVGGKYSQLIIDSDDVFSIMMTSERCPIVTIQLNYLDRRTRREILINTDEHSIKVDLINATLIIDDQVEQFIVDRDLTYSAQHKEILNNIPSHICSLEEGLDVLQMIFYAEKSSQLRRWCSKNEKNLYNLC